MFEVNPSKISCSGAINADPIVSSNPYISRVIFYKCEAEIVGERGRVTPDISVHFAGCAIKSIQAVFRSYPVISFTVLDNRSSPVGRESVSGGEVIKNSSSMLSQTVDLAR